MGNDAMRAVDASLAGIFTERKNCDLNVCSFSRNAPAGAALTLRILPGAHVADASPFSPHDEGEAVVAGRFQVLSISANETVLRQAGRLGPAVPSEARSGALPEIDCRDLQLNAQLEKQLGSFAEHRA